MKTLYIVCIVICVISSALCFATEDWWWGLLMIGFAILNYLNLRVYQHRKMFNAQVEQMRKDLKAKVQQQKLDELYGRDK